MSGKNTKQMLDDYYKAEFDKTYIEERKKFLKKKAEDRAKAKAREENVFTNIGKMFNREDKY